MLPTPPVPNDTLPGFAFAYEMNDWKSVAGSSRFPSRRRSRVEVDVGDIAHRHQVLVRVVGQRLVQQRVHRQREPVDQQEGIAVRGRLHDGVGADDGVGARTILE